MIATSLNFVLNEKIVHLYSPPLTYAELQTRKHDNRVRVDKKLARRVRVQVFHFPSSV